MIRHVQIPHPNLDFLPIPDPGSRGQKDTGSRIPIRNTRSTGMCTYSLKYVRIVFTTPSIFLLLSVCRKRQKRRRPWKKSSTPLILITQHLSIGSILVIFQINIFKACELQQLTEIFSFFFCYLDYGGFGFGSPSQRQKQHQKYRAVKANEAVFQHRYRCTCLGVHIKTLQTY
jgi:hypothetical protein